MKKIIIGARGSKLSLAYATKVKNLILESSKDLDIHIKTIKTSGDIHQDIKLSEIGGKNLYFHYSDFLGTSFSKSYSRNQLNLLNVVFGNRDGFFIGF